MFPSSRSRWLMDLWLKILIGFQTIVINGSLANIIYILTHHIITISSEPDLWSVFVRLSCFLNIKQERSLESSSRWDWVEKIYSIPFPIHKRSEMAQGARARFGFHELKEFWHFPGPLWEPPPMFNQITVFRSPIIFSRDSDLTTTNISPLVSQSVSLLVHHSPFCKIIFKSIIHVMGKGI